MSAGAARKLLLAAGLILAACGSQAADPPRASDSTDWPEWSAFAARFVEDSGRVVDLTFGQKSTSEGQSYGLFFALVANDRRRFDAILNWTNDNLAGGALGARLPAWLWGRREDGSWGVKDDNSASDGDLWLAYTLLEAGRLWNAPAYAERGRRLLAQVREKEIAQAGANAWLLPGAVGFALEGDHYRIDPSYLPGFMFESFAAQDPDGPWRAVWDSYLAAAPQIFAAGVAPDLCIVDAKARVTPDSGAEPVGSYDAIRVYLWAGMSGDNSRALIPLLAHFAVLTRERGAPPEKVDVSSGAPRSADFSPIGFSGAVLPFLRVLGDEPALDAQLTRLAHARLRAKLGGTTNYYDQALILFGKGWNDGRYHFDSSGRLAPNWAG